MAGASILSYFLACAQTYHTISYKQRIAGREFSRFRRKGMKAWVWWCGRDCGIWVRIHGKRIHWSFLSSVETSCLWICWINCLLIYWRSYLPSSMERWASLYSISPQSLCTGSKSALGRSTAPLWRLTLPSLSLVINYLWMLYSFSIFQGADNTLSFWESSFFPLLRPLSSW